MLVFLYSCNYDDDALPSQHPFEFNARMYALADKYGIEDLKDLAKRFFSQWLPLPRRWVYGTLVFVKALRVIYTTTLSPDRGLRDPVIRAIKLCRVELRKDSDFMEMLGSGMGDGEFAMDVFDALLDLVDPELRAYQCIKCDVIDLPAHHHEVVCRQCNKEMALVD